MRKLLLNEIVKIRYSKVFLVVMLLTFIYCPIAAFTNGFSAEEMVQHGFSVPISMYSCFGIAWFWIFGAVTACVIAGEFNNGVIHNILSCGISRRKYFAAKMILILCSTALAVLIMAILFFLISAVSSNAGVGILFNSGYLLKFLLYCLALLIVTIEYAALSVLLSYILESTVFTFGALVVITIVEAIIFKFVNVGIRGPVGTIFAIQDNYMTGNVFCTDFLLLLLPGLIFGIIFVFAGYVLFMKKDIR